MKFLLDRLDVIGENPEKLNSTIALRRHTHGIMCDLGGLADQSRKSVVWLTTLCYKPLSMDLRLTFTHEATAPHSSARAGTLQTRRGLVETPIFMPVGTQATVRGACLDDLRRQGSRILLANTYHLLLRPGPQVFRKIGGIHKFMNWDGLVLTDSGGFQIFSLPNARKITEDGAAFKSHIDGTDVMLSPETSIDMQMAIDSDIMMVLDECVPSTSPLAEARRAMELTHRWALRSYAARGESTQALFAIVQGACHETLRTESAQFLASHAFDGFAIGGLAVGETRDEREHFTQFATNLLPENKPRYLMGVGTPVDLLEAVHRGVDMFDCILPSLLAQQGTALTYSGWVRLRRSVYKFDDGPLTKDCACSTCSRYSRAYLHHLVKTGEGLGWRLIAFHNFYFYRQLMQQFRADIFAGTFADHYTARRESLAQIDPEYPAQMQVGKPKPPPKHRTLGDFAVVERASSLGNYGFIRQVSSGEVMHPLSMPDEEAEDLYVRQTGLPSLLSDCSEQPLVVWDVGLGAGHNAMAIVRLAEEMVAGDAMKRDVHIISFESDLDALRLALLHKGLFRHLRHRAPQLLMRGHSYIDASARLRWELLEGDFFDYYDKATPPDVVLFDPFSQKTNAEFWRYASFDALAMITSTRQAVLATYSTSTAVRASMLAAGFYVFKGEGQGGRREATIALAKHCHEHPAYKIAMPLCRKWLEKWTRSSAAFPPDLDTDKRPGFADRVRNHPQFSEC